MIRLGLGVVGGALCFALIGAAHAQGFAWLQNSPARYFNDQDWQLMRSALTDVLDNGEAGAATSWKNPDTGNSGSMEALDRSEHQGHPCRRARISNTGRGLTSSGVFRLCKGPDGQWKFAP